VAIVFNGSWLVPLAMGAGILYAVYYGIWATVTAWHEPESHSVSNSPGAARNHFRRRRWQDSARDLLRRRSPQEKFAELTGSFLMAAFTSIIATIVVMLLGASQLGGSIDSAAFFAWFAISSTLGSWLVLASGKALEGRAEEPMRRRFALLIMGLVIGAVSFGVQQLLMINLRDTMPFPQITGSANTAGAYANHLPLLPAYLAYFAGIFVVLRWWKQVDPLRSTRLSIWTTGVCVLWAGVLEMFWHFPQPWGLMLVASISIAAQLAAPWLTHKQRAQLREAALRPERA
jgi:Na+-driven multidrug efflux pump